MIMQINGASSQTIIRRDGDIFKNRQICKIHDKKD